METTPLPTVVTTLEITEGTPDLGVTSYWTDAEGNVVFGPNTPKEKMKTPVTGQKVQRRKESVTKTPPVEKDNKEFRDDKEGKVAISATAEPKASDSEKVDAEEEVADQPLTSDQSEDSIRLQLQ